MERTRIRGKRWGVNRWKFGARFLILFFGKLLEVKAEKFGECFEKRYIIQGFADHGEADKSKTKVKRNRFLKNIQPISVGV